MSSKIAVISPHFDDAVLSCGQLILDSADVTVITVFGGAPDISMKSGWNASTTGKHNAQAAVKFRSSENTAALKLLGASYINLPFWDAPYHTHPYETTAITAAIKRLLSKETAIYFPLGINHPDHILVSQACMELNTAQKYCYADKPYDLKYPHLLRERLIVVQRTYDTTKLPKALPTPEKSAAIAAYASQLAALRTDFAEFDISVRAPEYVWQLLAKR